MRPTKKQFAKAVATLQEASYHYEDDPELSWEKIVELFGPVDFLISARKNFKPLTILVYPKGGDWPQYPLHLRSLFREEVNSEGWDLESLTQWHKELSKITAIVARAMRKAKASEDAEAVAEAMRK